MANIIFYNCDQETLEKVYPEYAKKVTEDKKYRICTNVLCMVKYKEPKVRADEYIDTGYKLMTSVLEVYWNDASNCLPGTTQPHVGFCFNNVKPENVFKFAKMEDIDWKEILNEG